MQAIGRIEAEFIGQVIAEEHRQTPTERQVLHQPTYRASLVGADRNEFNDMIARLQAIAGAAADMPVGERAYIAGGIGGAAPVQGQAYALVLDQYAGVAMGETHGLLMKRMQPVGGVVTMLIAYHVPVLRTQFVAMQARSGKLERREQLVQLFKRATTDQCHGTFQPIADAADGFTHIGEKLHGVGACSEFDQGAIHIEEQRAGIVQQWRWRTQGERFSHGDHHASGGVYAGSRPGYGGCGPTVRTHPVGAGAPTQGNHTQSNQNV